jgi:hypothetical protein
MLFAEIPVPASGVALTAANGGDTCLDAEGSPPSGTYVKPYETIGFHHRYAGVACGHVVFVGGNVEVAHMWVTNTPTLMTNNPTLGLAKGEL